MIQLTADLALPGLSMPFARNEEIFAEEEPAEFVYKVISGVVRTGRLLADGRRQLNAFYLAGDVFGLERGDVHRCAAEAVTEANVALIRRSTLERQAERNGLVAQELWNLTALTLERMEQHIMLLGRKSALERVASFLLSLIDAKQGDGCAPVRAIDLSMSRSDVADYLGLTIETVSRSLSQLERVKIIALANARHINLLDRKALKNLATLGDALRLV
ncbi:MAG: helix-turn-helix domain-containing protein [Caulobacteraceae bacterium]